MSGVAKLVKACLMVGIVAGGLTAVNVADAGGWRGHGHGHHHHGGARVGVWIGAPLWWPGYYGYPYRFGWYGDPYAYGYPYPYAYGYPPAVVGTPSPAPERAPQPAADWYYCRDSQMFYPHVSECPSGWQTVPSTPPGTKP